MVDSEVAELQRQFSQELQPIANSLKSRVEDYALLMPAQYSEIYERMEELRKRVEDRAEIINATLQDVSHSYSISKDTSSRNEVKHLEEFKLVMELLSQVENNLCTMNVDDVSVVKEAMLLKDSTECLTQVAQLGKSEPLFERIAALLNKEVSYSRYCLLAKLSMVCKEFISIPPVEVKGHHQMKVHLKDNNVVSETLTALDVLGQLKEQISKWSARIFSDYCEAIVNSRSGHGVYDHIKSKNNVHTFGTSANVPAATVDLEGVFSKLTEFFTDLQDAIGEVTIGSEGRALSLFIGRAIQDQLMQLLTKNCLALAAPTSDKNDPAFRHAIEVAVAFRSFMIGSNFWNETAPAFLDYAEANDSVFINRRCLAVLTEAKKLICEPFIELEEVGTGDEITDETKEDFTAVFPSASVDELRSYDKSGSKFMQLLKCKVSKSAVKLTELLKKSISDALSSENEMLRARMLTTTQNILRLYITIAPKHHEKTITSVPEAAAVFFNNNYYICHFIMLLPFEVCKGLDDARMKEMTKEVYPILADNLWLLRELATASLEEMLMNMRRQISNILEDANMFVDLGDMDKAKKCNIAINGCIQLIRSVHVVWKEVMAESVFCKSLGNIVSFFLSDLANKFLDAEDIRSKDAAAGATLLEKRLTELQELFVIRGETTIHVFCDTAYFRVKEIIFCLNGSLQGISDRWCDGKGPLAQWMKPSEVRGLIKALFMNTEQRKDLLESIS